MKSYQINFLNAYGEECQTIERGSSENDAIKNFENWMPEGTIQKIITKEGIEMTKTLYFEGAGCVPRGEVENCRIRAAFTNDNGEKNYLEMNGMEVSGKQNQKTLPRF